MSLPLAPPDRRREGSTPPLLLLLLLLLVVLKFYVFMGRPWIAGAGIGLRWDGVRHRSPRRCTSHRAVAVIDCKAALVRKMTVIAATFPGGSQLLQIGIFSSVVVGTFAGIESLKPPAKRGGAGPSYRELCVPPENALLHSYKRIF